MQDLIFGGQLTGYLKDPYGSSVFPTDSPITHCLGLVKGKELAITRGKTEGIEEPRLFPRLNDTNDMPRRKKKRLSSPETPAGRTHEMTRTFLTLIVAGVLCLLAVSPVGGLQGAAAAHRQKGGVAYRIANGRVIPVFRIHHLSAPRSDGRRAKRFTTDPGLWPYTDNGSTPGPPPPSNCVPSCPDIVYQTGGVVQTGGADAVDIFWQPNGSGWTTFDDGIDNFVLDLQGTTFYKNLGQYYQTNSTGGNQQFIADTSNLAADVYDTTSYPSAGYVDDSTVQSEIRADITASGGPGAHANYEYNLILHTNSSGNPENLCDPAGQCFNSYSNLPVVLGWHYSMTVNNVKIGYSVESYGPSVGNGQQYGRPPGCPNQTTGTACHVDSTINILSHELNEMTTDPRPHTAWYFTDTSDQWQEVADACEHLFYNQFTAPNGQAANISSNGRYYNVAGEFNAVDYNVESGRCDPWY